MPESVLLVTSLTPRNIENQQRAVESWLRLGFSVVSLNARADIDVLGPRFRGVEFVEIQQGAQAACDESPVALDHVVDFLGSREMPVCGLIKPEIHLRATSATLRFLMEETKGALVYASHADVEALDDTTGEIRKSGFDIFLFDRELLKRIPSTEFRLGRSWWDLWLPFYLMRSSQGCPLKFVSFPFASRLAIAENGAEDAGYEKYGMLLAKFMDQGAYDALLAQSPETRRRSLEAMNLNVTMAVLFESRWLSCFPE